MKKLLIIALATVLCAAFAIPASAFESEFGGYWRTRAYSVNDWAGTDTGTSALVDTRTRLYYTAKFSDDLKLVNKFEFNNTWGDNTGGDIGTDGTGIFRIKNSYVDYTTGAMNFKMGLQGTVIGRAIMFDDDFAGVIATYNAGKNSFTARWMSIDEDTVGVAAPATADLVTGVVSNNTTTQNERDYYVLSAALNLSDTLAVSPYLLLDKQESTDTAVYYLGADIDAKVGEASVWSSLIYQTGETGGQDNAAYLIALGADAGIVHGQFFYASGDDNTADNDLEAFSAPAGKAYYWAEIMGFGVFDNDAGFDSAPNGDLSNVMALNLGTTLKPMDKLTVSGDLWYAQLAEDNAAGDADLGIEIDAKAKYNIHENLNIEFVAAYLIAGDAVAGSDSEDVMEYGTRLSLSF